MKSSQASAETLAMREVEELRTQNPELFAEVLKILSRWGPGEHLLVVVVAEAIEAAYERGVKGKPLITRPNRVQRTSARQAPAEKPTRVTRTRKPA